MSKMKNLVIVGDSAFAEIAYEYFQWDSNYSVVAFAVESTYLTKDSLIGIPVISFEKINEIYPPDNHEVFVAVVYTQLNRLRARLADESRSKGYALASYVSSRAFVWRNVEIGEHCFIFEDNTLQPFVKLGKNIVLWSGNHIGHHTTIRDHCFVSSHVVISGFCDIGESSFLGVNSTISNNVNIGRDNWLGPCTTIMKNTEAGAFFKSIQPEPAKITATRFFKVPS